MFENVAKTIEIAIADGRTDVMLSIIENYGKSEDTYGIKTPLRTFLNSCRTSSGSFLHLATELNQADIARTLLLSGSDPCYRNANGLTAIALATSSQMICVYEQELFRVTALSDTQKISELLNAGIDINCQDSQSSGNRPLHWAASYANLATVSFLLDSGADVNAVSSHGATALFDAVLRGNTGIIEKLIRHGADPAIKATTGKFANLSALDLATSNPEVLLALRDSFVITSPLMDAELHSDSSSSWVNSYGSCESLTTLDDVATSPSVPVSNAVNKDETTVSVVSSPLAAVHPNRSQLILGGDYQQKLKLLWPVPRHLHVLNSEAKISRNLAIYILDSPYRGDADVHEMMKPWHLHSTRLEKAGYSYAFLSRWHTIGIPSGISGVFCQVSANLLPRAAEAYSLSITQCQIRIVAGDLSGLYYAVGFLVQFLTLFSSHDLLPCISVLDWPILKCRATIISASLRKLSLDVPSFCHFIDLLSNLRLNHLFLLNMLGIDYSSNAAVSPSELLFLEKYCSSRRIALSLAVDIDSLESMSMGQFCTSLSSHLNCLSSRSYVYFGPCATHFLFKYAITHDHFPDLPVMLDTCLILDQSSSTISNAILSLLPLNAVLLVKCEQQQLNNEDIDIVKQKLSHSRRFANGVMLSTSLQESLTGCSDLIFHPLHRVCRILADSDVATLLLSSALTLESLTLHTFQLPGLAFGAGITWCPNIKLVDTVKLFPEMLDAHVYNITGLGSIIFKLYHSESALGCNTTANGASLAYQLMFEPDNTQLDDFTSEKLQKSMRDIKLCLTDLPTPKTNSKLVQLFIDEVILTAEILLFSCRLYRGLLTNGQNPNRVTGLSFINVGISNLPVTSRTDFANRLLEIGQRYQKLALQANTPSGVRGSVNILNHLFHQLIPHIKSNDIITI